MSKLHSIKLKDKIKNLPHNPGVYLFLDKEKRVIYVGKAKNLKKRVSSYFIQKQHDPKTSLLIKNIHDLNFIIVDTEIDALLLENTLIKKYKPKYNILLKDDKTYPWIVIKNEPFPRIFVTRNYINDGSEYFGPYTSTKLANTLVSMLQQLFKIRTCNLDLSPLKIKQNKYKPCLEYHIKNCKAPCIGLQSEEDYNKNINQIRKILKGHIRQVIQTLKEEMLKFAENLEFEKAQEIKEIILQLEKYQAKSTVVNPKLSNIDVISIIDSNDYAYMNFFKIIEGRIVQTYSISVKKKLNETPQDILEKFIIETRQNPKFGPSNSNEILVSTPINLHIPKVKIFVPKKGDKRKLIELSLKNLYYYKAENEKKNNKSIPISLIKLKEELNLKNLPVHIECFDNSNLFGTNPVAACVVFKNAAPNKKEYRKFNIKSVEGIDDFAMMKEIIYRRYKRIIDEKKNLPDLIIVDGGKGQLNAAIESLKKLNIYQQVDIISIAKRLDEIYTPNDKYPIYLDRRSPALKLVQRIRDEAHRFAISFHRQKRDKEVINKSDLLKIKGIGPKTYQKIIEHFKSISNLKNLSKEELAQIIGNKKANLILDYITKNQKL